MDKKTFNQRVDKVYDILFGPIVIPCVLLLGVIYIIFFFHSISDCEVEYANIIEWNYQNNITITYDYFPPYDKLYTEEMSFKYLKYNTTSGIHKNNINESGDLEFIREMFPVDRNYIFTICNGKVDGISRRNIVNDIFFYKLAKII